MTCGCASMNDVTAEIFYDTLEALAKEGKTSDSWSKWSGTAHKDMWYAIAGYLDREGLIEHGSGIRHSWLDYSMADEFKAAWSQMKKNEA